jgi:diguanylate cyclase (GGDEF)-like protein/PAS domain S-box-containing protein
MAETKILIVEDEQIIALDIQSTLEEAGYQVVDRVDRGEEAVKAASELGPDLVLMDINIKGEVDGIKAAEEIQTHLKLPVIFLTAFSDPGTLQRARIAEPFGYILKPFNERELISNIEMALYKRSLENERTLAKEALMASEAQLKAHQVELIQQNEQLRRTQMDLEEARALYLDLYNLAPVGYLLLGENGLILKSNQTAFNLLGLERGRLTQQGFGQFIQPDDREIFDRCIQQLFQTSRPQECEFRLLRLDGSQFWIRMEVTLAKELGQLRTFRTILINITRRKQAELEMLATQNQLEATLNAIPDLLFELGETGRYYDYRAPREDLLAAPPEIFIGKTVSEILPIEAAAVVLAGLREAQEKGHSTGKQFELQLAQGKFWFELSISRKPKQSELEPRFIVLSRDITARKRLEEAERDHRQLAEALLDTAMALNSTLELDDILNRILDNIGKLANFDAALVSILEESRVRKIRYHNNSQVRPNRLPIGDLQANLINVPILKELIKTKQPYLIPDIHQDPRWQAVENPGMQRIRSLICVPIEIRGKVVGIIDILSGTPDFFTPLHAERIAAFASQAAVAIENAQLFEQAQRLSLIDPLTGLNNMRYFNNFAHLEFERIRRYKRTLSVVMADIDHFKKLNDTYGHKQGDRALREIALRIQNAVRAVDLVARYGGEEFIILMPETEIAEAVEVAERVRMAISDHPIEELEEAGPVTISLGVVEINSETENMDELINQADKAMYLAKTNGRNRVESWKRLKSGLAPISGHD